MRAGAPQKFEERCRQLIAANPLDWRARLALGGYLARAGKLDAAFDVLLDALAHNPHGLTVHQALWDVMLDVGLDGAHVQRYITAARDAVFFLDPHVCTKCRYRSTELALCGSCPTKLPAMEQRSRLERRSLRRAHCESGGNRKVELLCNAVCEVRQGAVCGVQCGVQ